MSKSGVACYRNGGCGPYEMYSCSECPASKSDYVQFKRKPITNYDRIVSKSPEELAKFIEFVSAGCDYMFPDCPAHESCKRVCDQNDACRKGWLDWLKQEAIK